MTKREKKKLLVSRIIFYISGLLILVCIAGSLICLAIKYSQLRVIRLRANEKDKEIQEALAEKTITEQIQTLQLQFDNMEAKRDKEVQEVIDDRAVEEQIREEYIREVLKTILQENRRPAQPDLPGSKIGHAQAAWS